MQFYLLFWKTWVIIYLTICKGVIVMKFIISGKNLDVTDGLKAAIEEKIGKLERYFTPET